MSKKIIGLLCSLLMISSYLIVHAYGADTEEVKLLVGELRIFPVEDLERVAVGDPAVADVSIVSDRKMMLMAKSAGRTMLIIWDKAGERTFSIKVVAEDVEKLVNQIERLLKADGIEGVILKVEGQKIFLIGDVLQEDVIERIKEIIAPFPQVVNLVRVKLRQPLVQIDVEVLEVVRSDLKKLGVEWADSFAVNYDWSADIDIPSLSRMMTRTEGEISFSAPEEALLARLHFLVEEGKARTLANPNLVTLSGREASFVVGGEVPVVTVTEERVEVEWREYGVVLEIKPTVTGKEEITTTIKAEVSEPDWGNTVKGVPAFKSRQAKTELYLKSGETIILAGLIKGDESKDVDKVPFLGNIPILGSLFRSTTFKKGETELVISITPMVIASRHGGLAEEASGSLEEKATRNRVKGKRSLDPAKAREAQLVYSRLLWEEISKALAYPRLARENGWEGTVIVGLHLLHDGSLERAVITKSSGIKELDLVALAAVVEEAPFLPFPPQIMSDKLSIEIPIVYKNSGL